MTRWCPVWTAPYWEPIELPVPVSQALGTVINAGAGEHWIHLQAWAHEVLGAWDEKDAPTTERPVGLDAAIAGLREALAAVDAEWVPLDDEDDEESPTL